MSSTWHMEGIPEFNLALLRLEAAAEVAGAAATAKGAHLIEAATKDNLSRYAHSKGTPTPSPPGAPPAVITGTLRRSVMVDGPNRVGFGVYEARIGPTVVYSRIQELGGTAGRGSTLPPRPYLSPAVTASMPELGVIYREAWAAALH